MTVVACGDDDDDDDKQRGDLVTTTAEAAGANCAFGGVAILAGRDTNANGTLDADEVTSTQYVCKESGAALIVTVAEAPGANCVVGGSKITTGVDANNNGVLDADEVGATQYACSQDILADAVFGTVNIGSADEAAAYQTTGFIETDLSIAIASDEPVELTFPAVRIIGDDLRISCSGANVTVHLPLLRYVADYVGISGNGSEDGDCEVIFDAPQLQSIGYSMGISNVANAALTLTSLETIGYIEISSTGMQGISLPALKRLDDLYLNDSPRFDMCTAYDLVAQTFSSGEPAGITQNSASVACEDAARSCPILTVGATDYRLCFGEAIWSDARSTCQSFGTGWDLAYFTSQDDFTAVSTNGALSRSRPWIGYTDDSTLVAGAVEGTYTWVQNVAGNTYAPVNASTDPGFWSVNEPDGSTEENCAQILTQQGPGLVIDEGCGIPRNALCRQL